MRLLDVNVLVYAARDDAPDHSRYAEWAEKLLNGPESFGISELVLSSVVRIATNSRVFKHPSSLKDALEFVEQFRAAPQCVVLSPGVRHWEIFTDLCRAVAAKGNIVPDAYLAALAIETGSEWITTDRDYSRFPGLRWSHPLD